MFEKFTINRERDIFKNFTTKRENFAKFTIKKGFFLIIYYKNKKIIFSKKEHF